MKSLQNNKTILITGCAGFIGFHTSLKLLSNKYTVVGIDNLNNYYDKSLKKNRLKEIFKYSKKKKKNLFFINMMSIIKSLLLNYSKDLNFIKFSI